MSRAIAAERVQAGVELLDEKRPGWRELINLRDFSIYQSRYCILGQLYGNYHMGVNILFGPENWSNNHVVINHAAQLHGFDGSPDAGYYDLQRAWVDELTRS